MKYDFETMLERRGRDAIAVDMIGKEGSFGPAGPKPGFMVPHPPMIIPEIGRESEEQVRIARQKGGIRESEPYRLERFEVVRHY